MQFYNWVSWILPTEIEKDFLDMPGWDITENVADIRGFKHSYNRQMKGGSS